MIRTTHRRSLAGIVAMLALASASTGLITGCGFKGPLYLPPPKPATPESQAPKPAIPVDPVASSASGASGNTSATNPAPAQ
ncbi:LPS translocon maturation chaperone LptM [Zwartia sp.]|uniref:LPS translocon maturation chaperone LptM n=1 Tax=Zwartia sp. TaxID=2978004 RepID=UPI00271EA270|nr:lipoprotein [Zwartia sp.]MDO9023540.1 lipoprotein [Zwartia sp.]